jgi:hypothetical protein
MHIHDKIFLKKRDQPVNNELKNIYQIEHSRHRSFENFLINLYTGLIAYSFLPKKLSLSVDIINKKIIAAKC